MKNSFKWGLFYIALVATLPAAALAQETVFTDPNCCVLLDTKLSDEMVVAPGPFPSGYFAQFDGEIPGYVGEYQGTYGNDWRPMQSTYRGPRSSGLHGGIDIYAPSVIGPVRAPIVAPVGGQAVVKPDDGIEKLGNRVWIRFQFQGENYRMMLGHLSEFSISTGPVVAGQKIGYAGCKLRLSKLACWSTFQELVRRQFKPFNIPEYLNFMCNVGLLPDISCVSRRTSCDSRRTAQGGVESGEKPSLAVF